MILTSINIYWFILPLVLAVSLVYAASRHESWPLIWAHALRVGATILGILLAGIVILLVINTQV